MRALNNLTQNLIESLTQLLQKPGEDALQALEVCAPVLIEQLQLIQVRAVDRRDIDAQLQQALGDWLRQHPQPEAAQKDLLDNLRKQALISPSSSRAQV
ncbi:conserved hypothetical protein [Pseudomonas sp. 8Z]|uniref:hypothetical protein n=1 Tax=Pseudomonas sp. 8Z TaxID=2653166 RepID=UPI0012EF9611|nr:hypothetical protein [Pseudomonas sp. 8Z]VXC23021.1 conserved hypothetical protein [Pseudomonas sp. 8Z]